jgi:rod shape-determining protein MreB
MDDLLRQETGLPVYLADEPLTSAALGTGKCVEDFDAFTRLVPSDARG